MRISSLVAALVIVGTAMAAATVFRGRAADWPPAMAAPIVPAWYLLSALGGGPHGLSGTWWHGVTATFIVALLMWWSLIQGCRRAWGWWGGGEMAKTRTEIAETPDYGHAEFWVAMQHLYHHLNTAWNSRNATEDQVGKATDEDFNRWSRFPSDLPMMET